MRSFSSSSTHRVFNQVSPLVNYDLFKSDRGLVEAVEKHGGAWAQAIISRHGQALGSSHVLKQGDLANRNPPTLRTHDANGRRCDLVEYHPAYHELMTLGIESGATTLPWNQPRPGAHVARAALMYMQNQADAGHCCPLVMTFACVPCLRSAGTPLAKARVLKLSISCLTHSILLH